MASAKGIGQVFERLAGTASTQRPTRSALVGIDRMTRGTHLALAEDADRRCGRFGSRLEGLEMTCA
jgi:hypothetical protein